MTADELIAESFQDLGVIRVGESLSTAVKADALIRLNQFVSSVSTEQLMTWLQKHTVYNLSAGVSRYTFGVGGTFGTVAAPMKVTGWRATYGSFVSGGKILTFEELQAESQATLGETTSLPRMVGADNSLPWKTIGVHPVPNSTPGQLELSYWSAIGEFALSTTTLASLGFPDGWSEFLHFGFAVALLPRYGRQGFNPEALIKNAQLSKEKLATLNAPTQQAPSA